MADLPDTRPSLLLRLRDPGDAAAWRQCVEVYGPAVYRFARKQGLQDADAADVTQDVFGGLTRAVGGLAYDPARGTFRGWLFTIAHRRVYDHRARARRQCPAVGEENGSLRDHPAHPDAERAWDEEWDRARFAWAADRVRARVKPAIWEAFRRTAIAGENPTAVAGHLGLPVAQVYLARSRVMARLRDELAGLDPE